jgi:hypothetical protein
MALLKMTLRQFGLHKDRFALDWVSAGEAERYATVVNNFIERVTELGPSPYRKMREEHLQKEKERAGALETNMTKMMRT